MSFTAIPPFTNGRLPVSNVTPFTYGDGYTYLNVLERLREYVNSMIDTVNLNTDNSNDVVEDFQGLIAHVNGLTDTLISQIDAWEAGFYSEYHSDYSQLRLDLITLVKNTVQTGVVFNPTNGAWEPIHNVINDVYDYLRVYGYTAAEYDALELTVDMFVAKFDSAYDFDVIGRRDGPP